MNGPFTFLKFYRTIHHASNLRRLSDFVYIYPISSDHLFQVLGKIGFYGNVPRKIVEKICLMPNRYGRITQLRWWW